MSLPLGKGETDFFTSGFVFFVYVFNKSLEVLRRFIGHGIVRFTFIGHFRDNYSIYSDIKPDGVGGGV